MSTMKDRLHTGELYLPGDEEIMEGQRKCLERLYDFNQTRPGELEKRQEMLKEMFAEVGENCYIEPPFHANFGGAHVHFGKNVYANFNLTCVDDTHIYVGDYTMFGPNVTIATAGHPLLPSLREGVSVQYAGPYREKLLDRCGGDYPAGDHCGRQCGDRRGKHCHKGSSLQCAGCGKSLPCTAGDQ